MRGVPGSKECGACLEEKRDHVRDANGILWCPWTPEAKALRAALEAATPLAVKP